MIENEQSGQIPLPVWAYVMSGPTPSGEWKTKKTIEPYFASFSCRSCLVKWKALIPSAKPVRCWCCGKFAQRGTKGVS